MVASTLSKYPWSLSFVRFLCSYHIKYKNSNSLFPSSRVLCQEFLKGKEYVIDQVSREGVHKTMMVWVYDKRP